VNDELPMKVMIMSTVIRSQQRSVNQCTMDLFGSIKLNRCWRSWSMGLMEPMTMDESDADKGILPI
jgi:hypothetical protein